ncbi:hypothetical protein R6Q59_006004, partial [Mikania micrantha]
MYRLLLILHLLPCFFFFTAIRAAAQSYNQYGNNCPSYTWGDVNISYPFWKMGSEITTPFCGYQGFGINSTEAGGQNISLIAFGGDYYYIRNIDYNYRRIDLADYEVSSVAPGPPTAAPGSERNSYVNVMNVTTEEDWGDHSCADKVVTTVFPRTDLIPNLSVTYGTLLQGGFELQWGRMDDCERCEDSNGRCGNDITTGFRCFCPDGTVRNNHCKGGKTNLILKL